MMEVRTHITITSDQLPQASVFPVVQSVDIARSRSMMEETALVTVPNVKKRFGYIQELEPGASIKIELGYNDELHTEFEGKVVRFSERGGTFDIEAESALTYDLKRGKIQAQSWEITTLADVIQYIAPEAEVNCPGVNLEDFRLEEMTPYLALKKLARKYAFDVFVRGSKLFCVLQYTDTEAVAAPLITYHFQRNAKRLENGLVYKKASEIKIKVKGVSVYTEDGKTKKREYEAGDDDGGMHTLNYYEKTAAELKELVDAQLDSLKFDGVQGWFFGFWKPNPITCQTIKLVDDNKPVINGSYVIDRILTQVNGSNGFKRRIFPGKKVG